MTTVSVKPSEAMPHTAVYRMHKYFARRPWNVFAEFVSQHSSQGEIVLDPFCGGGVTVVEGLKLGRKAVGVDVNPIATYVTTMECTPADLSGFSAAFSELSKRVGDEISSFYRTRCNECQSEAIADWLEWDEKSKRIKRLSYDCLRCGKIERRANQSDQRRANKLERDFASLVKKRSLWFPTTRIPRGDKTDSLLARKFETFQELFTRRNLLALSIIRKEILNVRSVSARELLLFVLSSSLKWASRQSHLRGRIVEGWAMHAYWVYPKSLELNVWNVFKRRYKAVYSGKRYSDDHIGTYCEFAQRFNELIEGTPTCLVLNQDAAKLPIPDNSIDAVITDPPYGGNVNYAELSDFWYIWMNNGQTIEKKQEAIINRTQGKTQDTYQRLLEGILQECNRVLKPGRHLVSTFNSKDFSVVASFIIAASRAGLRLLPDGVQYQAPIRPYMTTFHAMQIGAFVGDFVFVFEKDAVQPRLRPEDGELHNLKQTLAHLVDETAKAGRPEPRLREQAYAQLIPFLAKYAVADERDCRDAASFFESKIRQYDGYFKTTRKALIDKRKRDFGNKQRREPVTMLP